MKNRIISIKKHLEITFLTQEVEIIDETYLHDGHANYTGDEETHLYLVIRAAMFDNMSRLQRHKKINKALENYFTQGLHALKIEVYGSNEQIKNSAFFD